MTAAKLDRLLKETQQALLASNEEMSSRINPFGPGAQMSRMKDDWANFVRETPATFPELGLVTSTYTAKPTLADDNGAGNREWDRIEDMRTGSSCSEVRSQPLSVAPSRSIKRKMDVDVPLDDQTSARLEIDITEAPDGHPAALQAELKRIHIVGPARKSRHVVDVPLNERVSLRVRINIRETDDSA